MPNQPSSQASAHAKDRGGYVPLIGFLRRYGRGDFQRDLVAGLIVAAISVPQAVAYAFLAGLPPQAGLYACLAPMVIYAVLGSSRHLVVGPVAVAALMVAAAIGLHAPNHQDNHLGVATVICLEAGLFLLLLRVTQMGGLVHLLSHPVVTGFVNAAAILIIISQLSALTGIPKDAGGIPVATVWSILTQASAVNIATLVLGAASLALLWLARLHRRTVGGRRTGRRRIASCRTERPRTSRRASGLRRRERSDRSRRPEARPRPETGLASSAGRRDANLCCGKRKSLARAAAAKADSLFVLKPDSSICC